MKKCKSCHEEINDKAKKCPKCQADQRNWFMRHPILTGLFGLVILGVAISALNQSSDSDNTSTNTSDTATQQQIQEATEIDVKTLGDAFNSNQVAAEKEWNGKLVKFSAEISNITDGQISFHNVDSEDFSMTQIACRLKDKDQALTVQNGQTIIVQGVVGDQMIGVIDLKDCEVIN